VIAGPTIGATLARFGADVDKIDPVTPTYSPDVTVVYGLAANRGKRSILLNITDEAEGGGRAAFEALVRRSDVLVANATSASLERLRCTPSDLDALNPKLVLCRFDAWGGPNEGVGPRSHHLGYDDNIQAALGIMERFGGGLGRVEEHAHVGTVDVIAGVAGALACVAALYHREANEQAQCRHARTGAVPCRPGLIIARASLAALGQLVQYPFCCGSPAQLAAEAEAAPTTLGPSCRGEHALLRCYQASDGEWFLLHASLLPLTNRSFTADACAMDTAARGLKRLAATHPDLRAAIEGAPHDNDAALAASLAPIFRSSGLSAEVWVHRLQEQDIAAVVLCSLRQLREQHTVSALDLHGASFQFLTDEHPAGTALTYFAPLAIRPALTPLVTDLAHAPRYGEHTAEVLREVGIDPMPLFARNAASDGWSAAYLPGLQPPKPQLTPTETSAPPPIAQLPPAKLAAPPQAEFAATFLTHGEIHSKAALGDAPPDGCPVCLEPIAGQRVQLACSHSLCTGCAIKCGDAGFRRCPVCREPHLLHPSRLAQRSRDWRQSYGAWRGGKASGARGEVASIRLPSPRELLSGLDDVGHSSICGDVHHAASLAATSSLSTGLRKG